MTLHLVAQHFKSFAASPQIHSTDPEFFTFTSSKKQTWLFTPDDGSHPYVHELLSHEEHWNINSYDKKLLQVVAPLIANGKVEAHMLYEMRLGEGKGLNTQLNSELEAGGIEIVDGQEWFRQAYPERVNLLHTEQVWVARSAADTEVFGHVVVLTTPSEVYIADVLVQPAHRSKGIAKKLMNFVHAREPNKSTLLTVFCENPSAVGLYFSLGYRILEKPIWVIATVEKI